MFSIIGAILSGAVKGLMAFFLPSKDQKLGRLEVKSQEQGQALNDIQKAQAARDGVRAGGTIGMSDDPADRDRH